MEMNNTTVGDDEEEEESNNRTFEDQFVSGEGGLEVNNRSQREKENKDPTVDYEEARNPNFNAPVVAGGGGGGEGETGANDATFETQLVAGGDDDDGELETNDATGEVPGNRLVSQLDEFYINNLLWPKIQKRRDFPCKEEVTDVDLSGEPEPVGFLNAHATSSLIPVVYFYKDRRQLTKPGPDQKTKPHFIRSAGNAFGKWTLNHTEKVMVGETQIGERRSLSYYPSTNNEEANLPDHQQYTYTMIEYSVQGQTMSLCRMTRSIRTKKANTNTNKKKNEKNANTNTNKKKNEKNANKKKNNTIASEVSQENNNDVDLVGKVDANAVSNTVAETSQETDELVGNENVVVDADQNQKGGGVDGVEIVNQNIAGVGEIERGSGGGDKTNTDTLEEDDVQHFNNGEGSKSGKFDVNSGITISAIDALIETGGATLTKPPIYLVSPTLHWKLQGLFPVRGLILLVSVGF